MADSNINLAGYNNFGNTGIIGNNVEPGIAKAALAIPYGTVIPPSAFVSQAALLTYLTAAGHGTNADLRPNRYFLFAILDTFEDKTKAMGSTDTGLYQFDTIKFNTKFSFRALVNKANHQEMLSFDNSQNSYAWLILDDKGNIWGTQDLAGSGGIALYTSLSTRVDDWKQPTTKDGLGSYMFTLQFSNRAQFNENFAIFQANLDPASLPGLKNAVMNDVSAVLGTPLTITTTTDIVCIMKAGQNSIDLAQYYQAQLTKACFVATNLTLGTTLTISTLNKGTIVVMGQSYSYLWFILSAAPIVGNLVQIALAAPSAVNAIVTNFNSVTEITQTGIDGKNAAVHIF